MIPNFDLKIEGSKAEELDAQVSLLLSTRTGTMPLDREFGIDMDFLDKPPEVAKSLYTAEITKKIAQFIPSIRAREVTWETAEGKLQARVVLENA